MRGRRPPCCCAPPDTTTGKARERHAGGRERHTAVRLPLHGFPPARRTRLRRRHLRPLRPDGALHRPQDDGERTVRALAVVLAETLAVLQGQNVTHAGVSPAAILITADGSRLTCFGAVRAAEADGVPRHGTPGPDAGILPSEQAAGGRPRPLGDVYALGATPAHAATGCTVPERDELPPSLRSLVGRSLSGDPARRPPIAGMIHALVDDSGSPSPTGFGPVTRAEALPGVAAPADHCRHRPPVGVRAGRGRGDSGVGPRAARTDTTARRSAPPAVPDAREPVLVASPRPVSLSPPTP